MCNVYPAELFVLRRQVREVSIGTSSVTRAAEKIAVRARTNGMSTFRAKESALIYLSSLSFLGGIYASTPHGNKPKGAA